VGHAPRRLRGVAVATVGVALVLGLLVWLGWQQQHDLCDPNATGLIDGLGPECTKGGFLNP
jgi:hypothetical protein